MEGKLPLPFSLLRTHRDDIQTIAYAITAIAAVAGLISIADQMHLQTKAINLQTEAINLQNEQLKLQVDALGAQNEQLKFQREALQVQINMNKPILTQNMYCPPLWPNTVNHADYTVYNIGRSSGIYKIQFQAKDLLLRALNFSCYEFSNVCTTRAEYAISASDKETYILDLRVDGNVEKPEFSVTLECMSEDCLDEPPKSWECKYAYNTKSKVYEAVL
ncbi:MAG: hypothetical protein V1921_01310 [Candidatus Altiarchaeota archaeon]